MDDVQKLVIETDARARSNQRRIDKLEETSETLNELVTSVKVMAQSIERMTQEMKAQGERLTTLEQEPAKRWNTMTRTIFTTVVSTLAGGLVGALIALLF